jgi:hypothetical protein
MTVPCKHGRGTELHFDPDIVSTTGKLIPLQENGLKHDCHLDPRFNTRAASYNPRINARAATKQSLSRIAITRYGRTRKHTSRMLTSGWFIIG